MFSLCLVLYEYSDFMTQADFQRELLAYTREARAYAEQKPNADGAVSNEAGEDFKLILADTERFGSGSPEVWRKMPMILHRFSEEIPGIALLRLFFVFLFIMRTRTKEQHVTAVSSSSWTYQILRNSRRLEARFSSPSRPWIHSPTSAKS
jgi:hypothetical protein